MLPKLPKPINEKEERFLLNLIEAGFWDMTENCLTSDGDNWYDCFYGRKGCSNWRLCGEIREMLRKADCEDEG